jgi:hypothetical protein
MNFNTIGQLEMGLVTNKLSYSVQCLSQPNYANTELVDLGSSRVEIATGGVFWKSSIRLGHGSVRLVAV